MKDINALLQEKLERKRSENKLRTLSTFSGIDFTSNDYLGLANSQNLTDKIISELQTQHKNGSGGSRLLSGNSSYSEALEQWIAQFHHAESGLIYNSGYDANIGLFSSIADRHDVILYDEFSHASIIDGIRLSFAKSYKFSHNNIADLEQKLSTTDAQNIFIVVESVYSMDGDISPLEDIIKLAKRHQAHVIIDEAHATGVIGESGKGLVNKLQLEKECFARIHTFGKALGVHGAIILGTHTLRQYLINTSRSFIYTTALPIHSLTAIKHAYQEMEKANAEREHLTKLIQYFQSNLTQFKKIQGLKSDSPIQGIILPGNTLVKNVAAILQQNGFDIRPILSPTVPIGKERLRICLHAFNTKEEIDSAFTIINNII